MKMRIGRSLTALLLIVSMIAASLFQPDQEVVQAAEVNQITEEQLFMQAPLYLNNDAYNNVISRCAGYAGEAIDSVSSEETVMASYMYSLKNGVSYLWNELWAAAGVTDSTYKDFEENAIKDVVFEYMSVSQNVSKAAKNVDKDFKWIDKAYDIHTEVGKNSFREAFQKNYPKLTEEQRGEMIDALFNNADKLMKYAKTGIELFMLTAEILELQAIGLQALDDLIVLQNQINDPAMRDALVSLRNDITSGIGTYIVTHYLVDKVLTQVWKEAQKALNGLIASSIEWSSLSWSLSKLIIDVAVTWYEKGNPSVSDMVYSSLLYSYWCCCENAVSHYQCLFLKGEGTEDDIRYYEAAMNLDIACMKILLSKSKKLVKNKNELLYRRMESWEDALGDSVNYQVYMDGCMRIANQAIADGKLLITDESVTIKDQNGTVIDEHYDSTESIKARFAAIQGEFPPNSGYIWDGDWGGAIQCFGFVRMVFYKLFDCNMPNSYVQDARYKYRNENNVVLVGQLPGNNVNNNSVKALLQQGRLGDIIQASGSVYGQHTMVFVSANENGVTVYDCNAHMNSSEPDCLIHQWEVSWNTLSSWYGTGDSTSENGISLYRAANYASVYGDGGGLLSKTLPDLDCSYWGDAYTEGIEITPAGVTIDFKSTTYADAKVWNTPAYVIYTSADGKVGAAGDAGYTEYWVLRSDGWGWSDNTAIYNVYNLPAGYTYTPATLADDFDWAAWVSANKAGVNCKVTAKLDGNKVVASITNNGLTYTITATIDMSKKTYVALTGQKCKLTNINILNYKNTTGTINIKDGNADGGSTSDISLRFLIGDSEVAAAQIENHTYSISGVSDGIYTMEASKPDYAARKYSVMITKGTVEPVDVVLHRIGDIDGDGNANMRDLNRVCDHIRGRVDLLDYDFSCGDINGDGLVNTRDLNRICDHIRKKKMLWN